MKFLKGLLVLLLMVLVGATTFVYQKNKSDIDAFGWSFGGMFDGRKLVFCQNFRSDYYQDCYRGTFEKFSQGKKNPMILRAYFMGLKCLAHKDALKAENVGESAEDNVGEAERKTFQTMFNFVDLTYLVQKAMITRNSKDQFDLFVDDIVEAWFYVQLSDRFKKALLEVQGSELYQEDNEIKNSVTEIEKEFGIILKKRLQSNTLLAQFFKQ